MSGSVTVITVRRSGGFLGRVVTGSLDLAFDDPRASEVRDLLARIEVDELPEPEPRPDRYVHDLDLAGTPCRVVEERLTDDLQRLVDLILG